MEQNQEWRIVRMEHGIRRLGVRQHPHLVIGYRVMDDRLPASQVSRILSQMDGDDRQISDEILPLVYNELRQLARAKMAAERPGQTLQPTALVHEAYVRLVGGDEVGWDGRGHFFGAAAEAMRRILIERARRKLRVRHGGDRRRTTFDGAQFSAGEDNKLLEIDDALSKLESRDKQMADVVKLRFFAGLNVEECGAALSLSPRTIDRQWAAARAWLQVELGDGG
jgi:RNA polymerase sigma factor (TIGR02999 family)